MNFAERCAATDGADLRAIDALVAEFYDMPGNGTGGRLHIVLDDSNIGRDSIEWCLTLAEREGDADAAALARLLLRVEPLRRLELEFLCNCCRESQREDIEAELEAELAADRSKS